MWFGNNLTSHRHNAYTIKVTSVDLKRLRAQAGHTQASLAKELGVHLRTVTRWEIGEIIIPRVVELALRYIVKHAKKDRRR